MSEPLYPDFVTLVTQMSGFASFVMVETRIKVPSRPEPNLHMCTVLTTMLSFKGVVSITTHSL